MEFRGTLMKFLLVEVFLLAMLLGACATNTAKVQGLAEFDLNCDKDKIKVIPLQSGVYFGYPHYGVEGCGRRARYVCIEQSCLKDSETSK